MHKCYYCQNKGVERKEIPVDCDIDFELDEQGNEVYTNHTIYSNEWLCKKHLNQIKGEKDE